VRHHAYDAAHVGHAQVYLTFDILQRRLIDLDHEPGWWQCHDVDDDISRKARELGVHYLDLAAEEMARFDANMGALALLRSTASPLHLGIPTSSRSSGAVLDGGHPMWREGGVLRDLVVPPLRPGEPPDAS